MKEVIRYIHDCNRCDKSFESKSTAPLRCGKCGSPYWNKERIYNLKHKTAKTDQNIRL